MFDLLGEEELVAFSFYGWSRYTQHTPCQDRSIHISASPGTVWELLAWPEGLRAWFEPGLEINMEVGGQYRFRVEDFDSYISGYVLEIEPEKRLVLSWREDDWNYPIRLTFTLEAVEGGTLVTHQYDGFAGIGSERWPRTVENYNKGMDMHQSLAKLKQAVEARNAA